MKKLILLSLIVVFLSGFSPYTSKINADPNFELFVGTECGSNTLKWDSVKGSFGYYVYRGATKGQQLPEPLTDFPLTDAIYTDKDGLVAGKDYCYYVTAINENYQEIARSFEFCIVAQCDSKKENAPCTLSLKYQVGEKNYWVNDKISGPMEAAPEIKWDRTFLVMKYVCDHVKAKLGWNASERKVTLQSKQGSIIEFWIGKNKFQVNGIEMPVDENKPSVVPYINGGRTMIPLRKAGESLGCKNIVWNPQNRIAELVFDDEDCSDVGKDKEVVVPPVSGCDWTQLMGGEQRTGKANDTCDLNTDSVMEEWHFYTGRMGETSIPAIAGNKIIFGSGDGKLYCYDKNTRQKSWECVLGTPLSVAPVVSTSMGKCWIAGNDNKMYCINIETGQKMWDLDCASPIVSSPLLVGDKLLFGTLGNSEFEGNFICILAETGGLVWRKDGLGDISSSGCASSRLGLVFIGAGSRVIHTEDIDLPHHKFYCFNILTGIEVWSHEYNIFECTPVFDDETSSVYVMEGYGWLYSFDANNGNIKWMKFQGTLYNNRAPNVINRGGIALFGNKLIFGSDGEVHGSDGKIQTSHGVTCVNKIDGTRIWNNIPGFYETDTSSMAISFPVICNNRIYIGTRTILYNNDRWYRGSLYCFDLNDGRQIWNVGYGATTSQDVSGVAISDGKLYAMSFWGLRVYVPRR